MLRYEVTVTTQQILCKDPLFVVVTLIIHTSYTTLSKGPRGASQLAKVRGFTTSLLLTLTQRHDSQTLETALNIHTEITKVKTVN